MNARGRNTCARRPRRVGRTLTAAGLAALAFVGCAGDADEPNGTAPAADMGVGGDDGCPAGTTEEGAVCVLQGELTADLTLTPGKNYLLRGTVFVGDDVHPTTLEVKKGTTVYGESSSVGTLVIRRGSKLLADGTAEAPIVFTSDLPDGMRNRGDWGGLILNGRAPINGCAASDGGAPCTAEGEGGTGTYGGDQPGDDSGVLRYVRVEFAGKLFSEENELNGIAFQGVGRGTTVDYVQVHMNKDDGVEFFGGTVDAKHIVLTGIGDDSLDWTDGWTGKVQFVVAQQYDDDGDQGIEADNNGDNNGYTPRSHPTLSNVTLIGNSNTDLGLLLREGTAANLHNLVVMGFGDACISLDQEATYLNAWDADAGDFSGELTIASSIADCSTMYEDAVEGMAFTVEGWFGTTAWGNVHADPMLTAPNDFAAPDFRPMPGSPALGAGIAPDDDFFDDVDYVGAFGADDWTAGWTTRARN
ncbi:MAG: hypothetical protein H6704_13895 [Myxococcales bacterium]|nr:hypothetical protein [Myxococcales bacterium]